MILSGICYIYILIHHISRYNQFHKIYIRFIDIIYDIYLHTLYINIYASYILINIYNIYTRYIFIQQLVPTK